MRTTDCEKLDRRFIERWSPRSFDATPLDDQTVQTLFEAARWTPSCFNEQPWTYVFARSEAGRAKLLATLAEGNRGWAERAPLLCLVFARRDFNRNGKPNRWAAYDTGAATFALVLQAQALGLVAHQMGGFDPQAAHQVAGLAESDYEAVAAIAVGRQGPADQLSDDLREMEAPNERRPRADWLREVA